MMLVNEDQQHLSTTSSPVERQKKTATKRRHDDNTGSESDVDKEEQQQTPKRPCVDWSDDEVDGKDQPVDIAPRLERRKKTSTKQKPEEDSDEEEQSVTAAPYATGGKKTIMKSGKTDRKIQVKRPWTKEEKDAVQQRMTKFIALKKVPAKHDCLLCISKVSPVLSTRTWKDVKYFVYNEIIKTKRKLEF
ncbi:transcriptional regulator ATRX homolog [Stegastes partitus]|uniref:Transcriptional regulator ATRX homolog n=1 Tax=Stegastes partitus TaxID=144197 RepID=A0A9Y4KDQ6_9TELE|nr:PREDICTED: transcriptional regulator ATRX homolog [Stegastes partitus]